MKKNIAVIYRLAFILFSIWAILEATSFNVLNFPVKLFDFTVFSDTLCLLCMLVVFIVSLRRNIGKGLYNFKTACTFFALLALAVNLEALFEVGSSGWILNVLLPLMMVIDHILFDPNAKLKFWQMLLWILVALVVACILSWIASELLNLTNIDNFFGLFKDLESLLSLLARIISLAGLAYLMDRVFSGEIFKDIKSLSALLFRILFIALEARAFSKLSGLSLFSFFKALRYYENLVNFMCFLCIVCVVIYNILHQKANAKGSYVFNRIKCFFTISILFAGVVYHFFAKGSYSPDAVAVILYYVAPIMMLLDWLFFDTSSKLRAYDPLLWICFPILYFCIVLILSKVSTITLYPMIAGASGFAQIGMFTVGLLIAGYIFYLVDRFIKGR